jgi:aldehyde dehydrogenase (NAD+)
MSAQFAVNARQRERVLSYIEKGDGATVALAGGAPDHLAVGYYVEPTVLLDAEPDAPVAQEEIFGREMGRVGFEGYFETKSSAEPAGQ